MRDLVGGLEFSVLAGTIAIAVLRHRLYDLDLLVNPGHRLSPVDGTTIRHRVGNRYTNHGGTVVQHAVAWETFPMQISGTRILITGGSRGIGESIARELGRRGAHLVLVARNERLLNDVADSLGPNAHAVVADLADPTQVDGLVARCEAAAAGPIDVLVNNAGLDEIGMFADTRPDDVRRIHQVNLLTPIELCRQAVPGMLDRDHGQIVNVSSMAGGGAFTGMTLYASTKGGLTSFTGVLNHELRRTNIVVTIVELGPIPTDMLNGIADFEPARRSFERAAKLQILPNVDRSVVAREVADAIAKGKHSVRLPKRAALFPIIRSTPQRILDVILRDLPSQESTK